MSLRFLCYALSLVTLLLAMTGLGVLDLSGSQRSPMQGMVSAAPSAGSDNRDNADNFNNLDNVDNTADNADNVADNSRDNSSGGNSGSRATPTSGRTTSGSGNTGGGNTSQADNLNENFDSLFDDDEFDDDDGGGSREGIDDFDLGLPPLPSPADIETAQRVTVCAPAGQETIVRTPDGSASVQVPASMPQSVQLTLRSISITSPTIPPTGGLRLGDLIVGLDAERCEGGALAALPAEVNLVFRYSDLEASALDETRLIIARLDPATQLWAPVANQVTDPVGNTISATVTTGGIYTVYQTLGWARPQQELGEHAQGDTAGAVAVLNTGRYGSNRVRRA